MKHFEFNENISEHHAEIVRKFKVIAFHIMCLLHSQTSGNLHEACIFL